MNSDVSIALLSLQCAAVLRPVQPVAAVLQHNQQCVVPVCVTCIAVQLVDVQLQLLALTVLTNCVVAGCVGSCFLCAYGGRANADTLPGVLGVRSRHCT